MLTVIVILTALNVLAFAVRSSVRIEHSGALMVAGEIPARFSEDHHVVVGDAEWLKQVRPSRCPDAWKAVRYYQRRYLEWRAKMGAREHLPVAGLAPCPRYLAAVWKRKAREARKAYGRWHEYHFAWWRWLPDKWQRIGACETGYGRRPGSWTWDSGTYVSAFGIYRPGYSQFAHEIGQLSWDETRSRLGRYPTPREQFNVALRIYYHFGLSGWGCRNA